MQADTNKTRKGSGTYISGSAIARLALKKNMQVFAGGFLTVLFLNAIIVGLAGNNEKLRSGFITYAIMLIPSVLLVLCGIKNARRAGIARRYDLIFMCDYDGTVTIEELARQTGKPSFKVLSELEWLFRKGVFRDCTLQKQGMPCVILTGRENSKTGFVNIVCKKCNGTTRLRIGTSGRCDYCGTAISSRNAG